MCSSRLSSLTLNLTRRCWCVWSYSPCGWAHLTHTQPAVSLSPLGDWWGSCVCPREAWWLWPTPTGETPFLQTLVLPPAHMLNSWGQKSFKKGNSRSRVFTSPHFFSMEVKTHTHNPPQDNSQALWMQTNRGDLQESGSKVLGEDVAPTPAWPLAP